MRERSYNDVGRQGRGFARVRGPAHYKAVQHGTAPRNGRCTKNNVRATATCIVDFVAILWMQPGCTISVLRRG